MINIPSDNDFLNKNTVLSDINVLSIDGGKTRPDREDGKHVKKDDHDKDRDYGKSKDHDKDWKSKDKDDDKHGGKYDHDKDHDWKDKDGHGKHAGDDCDPPSHPQDDYACKDYCNDGGDEMADLHGVLACLPDACAVIECALGQLDCDVGQDPGYCDVPTHCDTVA